MSDSWTTFDSSALARRPRPAPIIAAAPRTSAPITAARCQPRPAQSAGPGAEQPLKEQIEDAAAPPVGTRRQVFYTLGADELGGHSAAVGVALAVHPRGLILVSAQQGDTHSPDSDASLDSSAESRAGSQQPHGSQRECSAVEQPGTAAEPALLQCVRRLYQCTQADDPVEALLCASAHPAALLGLRDKGSLERGRVADLILLTDDLELRGCFIAGKLAWAHPVMHGALWWHI